MKLVKNYNDFVNESKSFMTNLNKEYNLVGYIKNSDEPYVTGDYYIFIKSDVLETGISKYFSEDVLITKNDKANGSSITGYLNDKLTNFIELLPEYEDNENVKSLLFGKTLKYKLIKSKELMDTISKDVNGDAILIHNSNNKITDGYLKIGMKMNIWSLDDFKSDGTPRIYFWGSNGGLDISNNGKYKYISKISMDKIYPMAYGCNPENYNNFQEVKNSGYSAVAYYMRGQDKSNGTVVAVFEDLPIYEIQSDGISYDSDWNKLD